MPSFRRIIYIALAEPGATDVDGWHHLVWRIYWRVERPGAG